MISPETYRSIVSGEKQGVAAALARSALGLAEPAYRACVSIRNRRFDRGHAAIHQLEIPIVSVGNLTLGGTGKTPMVAWLANWFAERNMRIGLVSRGYRSENGQGNDEARELAQRLPSTPHFQNPDRVAAARSMLSVHDPELLILDDGFQHRRIGRDLDIVLIDATAPFGYDHVFPRGMLREPKSSLNRADIVVLSRANLVESSVRDALCNEVTQLAPRAIWVEVEQHAGTLLNLNGQSFALDQLPPGNPLAFCGIGNPQGFRQLVTHVVSEKAPRSTLADFRIFPDHFAYPDEALSALASWTAKHPEVSAVLCTAKDLVKFSPQKAERAFGPVPLFAIQLELQVTKGKSEFEARLQRLVATSRLGE